MTPDSHGVAREGGACFFSLGVTAVPEINEGLRLAIQTAGSGRALARALGLSQQALSEWRRVPSHRILQVEAVTGVPRELLRPDLYRPQEPAAPFGDQHDR
jgi:Bacterial toxin YdaS